MKPIPLFLKKNSHPPIRAIFEKSAPPFYEGGGGGGGPAMFYVCQILAVKIISKGKHFVHKEFHSVDVQGRYC